MLRVALVAASLTACHNDEPLQLDMTADRAVVARDDSVTLSLRLVNRSGRAVAALPATAYGICFPALEVYDGARSQVSLPVGFCFAATALVAPGMTQLLPGESIAVQVRWYPNASRIGGQPIPAGAYHLFGRMIADQRAIYSRDVPVSLLP